MENNIKLYETKEVIEKYAINTTRVRCLNESEKLFIDKFDIKNKKVLVLGSGAGRVPVNLLLFGNEVLGIELSKQLNEVANSIFPKENFRSLTLEQGDATNLSSIPDGSFDVVFFPQNGLDLVCPREQRQKAILEMAKKVKAGGLLAFSSHNKLAYKYSYKVRTKNKVFENFFQPSICSKEKVVGGGILIRSNPKFIIDETKKLTSFKFIGFTVDARNRLDRLLMKNFPVSQLVFPYLLYVFKKHGD
jgi:SAM-dependent methyltransferase